MTKKAIHLIPLLSLILSLYLFPGTSFAYISETNSPANIAVGQLDFFSNSANQGGSTAANTLSGPYDIFSDGTRLFIADSANNRVLIYNSIPTSNNASANVVIGQQNMSGNLANQGGAVAANTLNNPRLPYVYNGKLILCDANNHRVLIYNSIPTSNNASANVVIGQQNMSGNLANQGGAVAANTLNSPRRVLVVDGKLFITDTANNRVLIFNSIPIADNTSANNVIGQADLHSNGINQGGSPAANTLYNPRGIATYSGKLIISEIHNHRVLIYNSIPTADNASANVVIGQTDMSLNSANQGGSAGANTLNNPADVSIRNGVLFIADTNNNRILIFHVIPTINNASANAVIGQLTFYATSSNQGGTPSASTLDRPANALVLDNKLYASDTYNNRVLIYNLGPESISVSALSVNPENKIATLSLSALGAYQMMISNYSDFYDGVWEAYATTKDWTLLGSGAQSVYAKFRDYALYESEPIFVLTNLPQTGTNDSQLTSPLLVILTIGLLIGTTIVVKNSLVRKPIS